MGKRNYKKEALQLKTQPCFQRCSLPSGSTNFWFTRQQKYDDGNNNYQGRSLNEEEPGKATNEEFFNDVEVNGFDSVELNRGDANCKESWRTTVSRRNLIVNYLPQHISDDDLHQVFYPFGKIESVRVMKDLKAGYSFGFGFVNFFSDSDGEKAKHALNESKLGNKTIKVNFARPASEDTQQSNLYVSNLPRTATENEVLKMFSTFGEVLHVSLLRDKILNIPRGVAFIRYRERNDALRAIIGMNGVTPEGLEDPINVRIALDYGRQRAASFGSTFSRNSPPRRSSTQQTTNHQLSSQKNFTKGKLDSKRNRKFYRNSTQSSTSHNFRKFNNKNNNISVPGIFKSNKHKRKFRKK